MIITAITGQKRAADRCSVFVDGAYSFSLSHDQLIEQRIAKGEEISEERLNSLLAVSQEGKLYNRALQKLSRRPHSKKEIDLYLQTKKASEEQRVAILERLEKQQYLDDVSFADYLVEQRRSFKSASSRSIQYELRQKGVSAEIIEEAVAKREQTDQSSLMRLVEKLQNRSRYSDEKKLISYLQSKGFRYADIVSTIAIFQDQE